MINEYKLDKIGDTSLAFVYLNKAAIAKRETNKAIIPTSILFVALFSCIIAIMYNSRKPHV